VNADIVVVGGGAAGLMAALAAARHGVSVLLVEAAKDVGRKILISGGGRCNVLPMDDAPARFVSTSPNRLVRRVLDRWPLGEQRLFFEELLGGPLREEPETKKLFPPSNRAKDVRDALRRAVEGAGAILRTGAPVRDVTREDGAFRVALGGETLTARRVILTTGGRSVLGGGADARGFDWAAAFGHSVRETYPALAPLTGNDPAHAALAGVSLRARVTARSESERSESEGGFLFTHRGYSGPAVLDVSHVVERAVMSGRRPDIRICFSEGSEENRSLKGPGRSGARPRSGASATTTAAAPWDIALRTRGGGTLSSFLRKEGLPDRLVSLLLASARVSDVSLSHISREARRAVVAALEAFELSVTGTEGYRTAEVTGGGVALQEVDPGSGRSLLVPGLYFAGEILDAFGPIGGFNFQWAWATGRTAGEGATRDLSRA
jgi:predicted flavoprotein YhiN